MINFNKVEITDKKWMEPLIAASDMRGCHQNFTNIFAWSEVYNYQVARVNDYLVVKGRINNDTPYYFYPAGWGDIKPVIETMKQDADDSQHEFILFGVSPENIEEINSLFPEHFEYQVMRDSFDYLYNLDKLVTLAGRKLQAKRNHINRFKANNNWSFEQISPENIAECWEMNRKWCKDNNCKDDVQLVNEYCAVNRCFDYFTELGLMGGLIRSDGRVIAYTMGEKLNSDTFDTHIEKAFSEIQGAYQMINREFAALIQENYPQIMYVNREEDMGYEGLRKAKLSYHPDKMEEKYSANYFTV